MKTKHIIVIFLVILTLFTQKSFSQTLDMNDALGPVNMDMWCWMRATKSIIYYYGEFTPSTCDIVEYARIYMNNSSLCPTCTGSPYPIGCNQGIPPFNCYHILNQWNIKSYTIDGIPSHSTLVSEFEENKPVMIELSGSEDAGHVIIGHGMYCQSVAIIDGILGKCYRPMTDIYPNRTWLATRFMVNAPKCSSLGRIDGDYFNKDLEFNYRNGITISAKISQSSNFILRTSGDVDLVYGGILYQGDYFRVDQGSTIEIYTNGSNCP